MWIGGKENIYHENNKCKKAYNAILISDEVDFMPWGITRDKERHYIKIKGTVSLEQQ